MAIDNSGPPWLTILLLVPLVGALLVAALPRTRPLLAKQVTLAVTLVELVLAIIMSVGFDQSPGAQFQFGQQYSWIKAFGVSYSVGADGIALVLIALTAVLVPVVVLASWDEVDELQARGRRSTPTFFALLLVLEAAMIGV